jgi:diacylglycerol kinase (ATP)
MEEPLDNSPDLDTDGRVQMRPPIRAKSNIESFKYALEGILDVFRTQKHMRFHFITVVVVLLAALLMNLPKRDLLIILFTVSLVIMAEMFNTAIEAVVDMVTQSYHPLAKFAKDAAAGAVLVATATSVLIGFMLIVPDSSSLTGGSGFLSGVRPEDAGSTWKAIFTGIVLLVLVTIFKVLGSRGKLLKGGVVSGHTALGFFLAATILLISRDTITAVLALMMALLIAQSRVEAKIHSLQEVITGALVAILLTSVVYWLVPR